MRRGALGLLTFGKEPVAAKKQAFVEENELVRVGPKPSVVPRSVKAALAGLSRIHLVRRGPTCGERRSPKEHENHQRRRPTRRTTRGPHAGPRATRPSFG